MSIFNDYKILIENKPNLEPINPKTIFPLNLLIGKEPSNSSLSIDIEEAILSKVKPSILIKEIYLRINKNIKYIPWK